MQRATAERLVATILALLAIAAILTVPFAIKAYAPAAAYWLTIWIWILFFGYCATAWNIIGGMAQQYSFGHAAFLGLGAYTSSILWLQWGITPWIGMIVGGLVAAAAGALISYPCFKLRGAFFSLATIAFAEMLRVGAELTDDLFGFPLNGARGLTIPPKGFAPEAYQFIDKLHYALIMTGLLAVALIVAWAVKRSRMGYWLAAIGDDEDAAGALGVDAARVKLWALLISACLTAIAGTYYAQLVLFIIPTRIISLDLSVQMVIMAVLGGMGTVFGPALGALVLVPLAEITRGYLGGTAAQGAHLVVYGLILILVIRYIPKGIESWVRTGCGWLVRRAAAPLARRETVQGAAILNTPVIALPEGAPLGLRARAGDALPLQLRNVTMRFGGAVGVKDLTLELAPGEVVGLIGPNGSGKTTVFNLITGFLRPQAGSIRLGEHELVGLSPYRINRLGVARTFQIVRPFIGLTTVENVMVAALPRCRSMAEARAEATRVCAFVGLSHRLDTIADGLSTGERKRLELARALATRPRLLLMDEVMGGLDQRSLPGMVALIDKIRAEGISLLVIEHNLKVITMVTQRLVMLNLGEKIRDGTPREVVEDPFVIDIYVGGGVAQGH